MPVLGEQSYHQHYKIFQIGGEKLVGAAQAVQAALRYLLPMHSMLGGRNLQVLNNKNNSSKLSWILIVLKCLTATLLGERGGQLIRAFCEPLHYGLIG